MWDAGFDVSFWGCPAKGGTGGHPTTDNCFKLGFETCINKIQISSLEGGDNSSLDDNTALQTR
jgi:hypothetical protein